MIVLIISLRGDRCQAPAAKDFWPRISRLARPVTHHWMVPIGPRRVQLRVRAVSLSYLFILRSSKARLEHLQEAMEHQANQDLLGDVSADSSMVLTALYSHVIPFHAEP